MQSPAIYRFGDFELHPGTRQLFRAGRPVAIQPKPFALLLYLVRHRDRVVPREELLARVWPGVRVNPQALGFALHTLRRVLGDDGARQAVIRTVPRAGVQLAIPVEVALPAARPGATPSAIPFLGRERLLETAHAVLEEVRGGEGRVLLLSGEAGIGKTRALERLADLASGAGFRVLHGRCAESEGAPAFWPWAQILRSAVSDDPPSGLLRVLGEGAREVAWMVPELRPYVTDLPQAPSVDARSARFLLFDSVTTFLRELVSETPHVLCIDDLHRADGASAALFQHVCRELAGLRLALVVTHRDNELHTAPAVAEAAASVIALPHARLEPLPGLDRQQVGELVRSLSGRDPSKAVVADLHQKTNGNPFFLDQIVRVLDSEGRLGELEAVQTLEFELPHRVQDAIRRQLRLLGASARDLVALASVIGRGFTLAELEGARGAPLAEIRSGLAEAVEVGVIRDDEADPTRYRFCHALVRDAIYAGLRHDRKAAWHARVGRAIECICGHSPGARSAEIANHYLHAGGAAELERAIEYSRLAARWASERAAVEEAPAYLERALALLDQIGTDDEQLRCEILIQYGDALTQSSRRDEARTALMEAAFIAKREGNAEGLAQAALRYAPDFLAIGTGIVDWDLVHLLEEALERLGDDSLATKSRVQARLAVALYWAEGSEVRAGELCRAAEQGARHSGDESSIEFVKSARKFAFYTVDDPTSRVDRTAKISTDREAIGLLERILRITALMQLGRFAQVDDEIEAYRSLAARLRQPQAMWYGGLLCSTRALMSGRFDEARNIAVQYLKDGESIQDPNAFQSFMVQMLMIALDRDGLEAQVDAVRQMIGRFPRVEAYRAALAFVMCELGALGEARDALANAIRAGCLEAKRSQTWLGSMGALAISARTLRDSSLALRVYERLVGFEGQFLVIGFGSCCWGAVDRFLGEAAAGAGMNEKAIQHFGAAMRMNHRVGADPAFAHSSYELARLEREVGSSGWREHRDSAARTSKRLGMRRLEERCLGME